MLNKDIEKEINGFFGRDFYRYFIFLRSYSRWRDDLSRRELWAETCIRYMDFMKENLDDKLSKEEYKEIHDSILNQEVMPSMRLLWSAGNAARDNNICGYNCCFSNIESLKDFADALVISCCGSGYAFSVEKESVDKLPIVRKQTGEKLDTHVVEDSKYGWADALLLGLETWFYGRDIGFDFSMIRPEGTILKTMGGRASGPLPLKKLLKFARENILKAQGRKLKPIEVHDILCYIGDCVVSGGTRRTALLSLSDLDDKEMRKAKTKKFWEKEPQRSLSNNSAVYKTKPTKKEFFKEWSYLKKSKTGERGIFNRYNFNWSGRRLHEEDELTGTNSCGEICLLNGSFCNLSSVVCRPNDTLESLKKKARIATIIGTYQATLTNFKYISDKFRNNCDKERLLGVSLNGQYDCPEVKKQTTLRKLKQVLFKTNKEYSHRFGIPLSAAIGTTKPEGTCAQLLNCSSGAHPRYSKYYIRRVRISATDPLFKMLKDSGLKYSPEVWQKNDTNPNTFVFEFPIKSPENSITRNDLSPIEQLEHWKNIKTNYAEHNVSQTVYIGKNDWDKVKKWVYNNFDIVGGLSFLPKEDEEHFYELAPYEEINEEQYNKILKQMPEIDFSNLQKYEKSDRTTGAQEMACLSGVCSIDDIVVR